jgi:hypothetical protein
VDEVPQADGRFFRLKRLGDLLDVVRALEPGA